MQWECCALQSLLCSHVLMPCMLFCAVLTLCCQVEACQILQLGQLWRDYARQEVTIQQQHLQR